MSQGGSHGSGSKKTTDTGRTATPVESLPQGGDAPTYVNAHHIRDQGKPHGKNITEGFEDSHKFRDGQRAAMEAEPGSRDDPSRVAEQQFFSKEAGSGLGTREAKVTGEGRYNVLTPDEST